MHPFVSELAVTAVKGFGVRRVDSVLLTENGAEGDRDLFLVDDQDKLFSATRSGVFLPYWARLEGDHLVIGRGDDVVLEGGLDLTDPVRIGFDATRIVDGHLVDGPWNAFASELAGRPLRLVRADQRSGAVDVEPVTVMGRASAEALGVETDGAPMDALRFRMLVTLDGTEAFEEDGWRGRQARIGGATIELLGPVPRCAATRRHPQSGDNDVDTLRRIREVRGVQQHDTARGLNLGVYAAVVARGIIRRGDLLSFSHTSTPPRPQARS